LNTTQKKIFIEKEADAWFERSISAIDTFNGDEEVIYPIIKRYNLQPTSILEIGCSAGHRLAHLKEKFPNASICGIEPSKKAIEYGKKKFHLADKEIIQGTADSLDQFDDASFDLIIVGFVFYVIDRDLLFAAIHHIDRLLKNKANLITIDFFSISPIRNPYHHVKDIEMYSYKQRYEDIFVASHAYHLIAKDSFSFNNHQHSDDDNFHNNYCVVLLKKDNEQAYIYKR